MKSWETVLKVLAALVAAAAIIFVIITYGDKIVAWFKKLFGKRQVTLYDHDEEDEEIDDTVDFAEEE